MKTTTSFFKRIVRNNPRQTPRLYGLLCRAAFLSFIICHLSFSPVGAQSFTQRIQQTGTASGKVTIHQDAAIDELVNGKPVATPAPKKNSTASTSTTRQQKPTGRNEETTKESTKEPAKESTKSQTAAATSTLRSSAEQSADTMAVSTESVRTRKVMGYRIQVFVGGKTRSDRQKAEQTGSALRTLFPGQKVYVHFYSPRWICRMGNYPTLAEAREMLDEVVRMGYDTATIVRGKITVPY